MIPITFFKDRRVAIFGLGSSGLSSARALIAGGAEIAPWDDAEKSRAAAQRDGLALVDLKNADWSGFHALVLAPGVPLTHPKPHWSVIAAKDHDVPVIGDVELFARQREAIAPGSPFVAITGTNGKSTTTALIAHLLSASGRDVAVGGNLGTPILSLEPPAADRYHVVEMSSYQIELTPSLKPSVGIQLNVTPDHLDRHGTMEHYAFLKSRVPGRADFAVVGVDDDYGRDQAKGLTALDRKFARISVATKLPDGYFAQAAKLYRAAGGRNEAIADLAGIGSLRGSHNAQNALAAFAACTALGLDDQAVREGLQSFPGLAHRMEEVGRRGNVLFINDSKATNADSAARALASFDNIFWIAGGLPKAGGITGLTEFFPRIRKAYLIGEAAADFARTLDGSVPHEIATTLERAVSQATQEAARDGDKPSVVLLSPACASFDQFANFEVRGDKFRELVKALLGR